MSIHVSYNQPDNEIHSYDGKPSAVVTGAGPAVIEIHMTAGEWDAANRLYYRQEATGVDGFVQASESNNQQFLLPCAYLASGELQIALNNPEQGLTTNLMNISITKMSSSGDLSDDDPQFTIDGKKRLVLVPGSQGILAVQFDNESESVTFKFPRYQDGVDLSTKTPYVNYRLPSSGELGKSLCSVDVDMLTDEYIYFSWTIDINVTMYEGSIKFQVEFSDSQGYRWQSQIAELPILTSLYNTGLEPYSPSFLEAALRQMQQYSSDAEAFAVGTRNGVPVAQGDPAYHKSALYLSNWFFERSVSPAAKEALLTFLSYIAYFTDDKAKQCWENLRDELYNTAEAVSISAVFDQGSDEIYDNDSLDYLRQYLTITATYEDMSEREVTGYTLSGILEAGTSTITVSYGGKTTTFEVVVSEAPLLPREYQQVEWVSANIQNYNLTAYIDTGFVPTVNSFMKTRLAAEGVSEGRAYLGVRDASSGSNKTFCIMEFSSAGKIGFMRWGASVQCIDKDTDFHVYELSPSVSKVDDVSYTMSAPVASQTISKPIRMFAWWSGSGWLASNSVRISSLELGDNGVTSHNFIACYRKADNEIGFYDTITGDFKTNEGTGAFTKGGDVE